MQNSTTRKAFKFCFNYNNRRLNEVETMPATVAQEFKDSYHMFETQIQKIVDACNLTEDQYVVEEERLTFNNIEFVWHITITIEFTDAQMVMRALHDPMKEIMRGRIPVGDKTKSQ